MIPNYTLADRVSSRKHDLATFVHEQFKWTIADQSLEKSASEWLCVDIDGWKIVNIYKAPNSQLTPTTFRCFNISVSILVTSAAGIQIGDSILSGQMENVWLTGQLKATLYLLNNPKDAP